MRVPSWYRRVITLGDSGPDVDIVRRKLGLGPGVFDTVAQARVRGMAKKKDVVDEAVAEQLGETETARAGLAPSWFTRPLERHDIGEDVRSLRRALGLQDDNRFEHDCEAAVRRLQSAAGIMPDGKVDATIAVLVGE